MPTIISHAITAVPISLGFSNKINIKRVLILSIIFSIIPDLDGIGYGLGITYNSIFGHRGFSHSILFIIIAALIFAYFTSPKAVIRSRVYLTLFLNFFLIGLVHILLDAMTNGGLGVALFSPFSNKRFFFPWRPIEVSAILPEYFFKLNGWAVIKFELLYLILPAIFISLIVIFLKGRVIVIKIMKKIIFSISIVLLLLPTLVLAQAPPGDEIFKARVIEIIEEDRETLLDGSENIKQRLKLRALDGSFKGEEVEFNGLGEIDVLSKQVYQVGDKVLAVASYDAEGEPNFYIVDFVRTTSLWILGIVFLLTLLIVGSLKGLRALIALGISFIVIVKYIIPRILAGASPLMTTLLGSFLILFVIIYLTEGLRARSHLAVISIIFSLLATVLIANLFVTFTRLTGVASEEVLFLFNLGGVILNLRGLLLAGIIIGALGVLDDVVISQVATVEELAEANPTFSLPELFKGGYRVGVSHIASMTNTLFLAYAGVSLPLLILFVSGESAFQGWQQALNTELIATEIVRTLAGSIGLVLAVPIATFISAWWFSRKQA